MPSDPWLAGFKSHLESLGLSWPLKLTCNPERLVWEPKSFGLTKPSDRDYLKDPALLELAAMVLEEEPRGGRFRLDDDCCLLLGSRSRIEWGELARWVTFRSPQPTPQHQNSGRRKKRRPRIIAPRKGVQARIPDAKLHRLAGNIHNPRPGPLSQGGDT